MKILVYQDEGVGPRSFKQTFHSLQEVTPFPVMGVNHRFFLQSGEWEKETALIVFPGGRDLPYHRKLQGEANARIAQYVRQGGFI